jgi:2-keto-4-pentenoate hydratase|tara:strand:- start:17249 stop:18160 length:912 start_codon:yes stop_codon:yes gene_type:complete
MKKIIASLIVFIPIFVWGESNEKEIKFYVETRIDHEIKKMSDDFLNLRPMLGFDFPKMSLSEAYIWQGEMAKYLGERYGKTVGYKTGGHNVGPTFPTFPEGGIRGLILEKMLLPSNSSIRVNSTVRGFLEADFAFRVKDDSINMAKSELELLAGIDAIIPFAEIPDPYYEEGTRTINGTVVSNMGSRFSFLGEPVMIAPTESWVNKINNFSFAVHNEEGTLIESGKIKGWYKPLEVVKWLRDHLISSGIKLKAGDILSLGNIGIIRQLHQNSPRGPAYKSNSFILSYFGLSDEPMTVTINIDR